MNVYRSPHEAYPFLSDEPENLACDFEILTDEIASGIGLLRAEVKEEMLHAELAGLCELVYHANPTLRTSFTVTDEEIMWLQERVKQLAAQNPTESCFVLPLGGKAACMAHLLRTKAKALVRLVYRYIHAGGSAPDELLDFCNLLSGYFFELALELNRREGIEETTFQSRNYKN